MNRRARGAALGVVLAVGLTGCGPAAGSTSSAARTSPTAPPAAPTSEAAPSSTAAPKPQAPSSSVVAAPPVVVAPPVATTAAAVRVPAAGSTVVLDAGHNGGNAGAPEEINRPVPAGGITKPCNTTGTATDAGYPEHAFTFDVVARTAALLRGRGLTVVLTRTTDTGVGPCVNDRAAVANTARAAVAVSVHADGAPAGARGFHVIEPALAPDDGNPGILEPSATAALDVLSAFGAATGEPAATYPGPLVRPGLTRRADLAGLNLARVPAVFIECGNMRNAQDAASLTDPGWRQRAAQGIADGVLRFLGRA
jgi:N-acetylmuramoyl-L-alanine amidase